MATSNNSITRCSIRSTQEDGSFAPHVLSPESNASTTSRNDKKRDSEHLKTTYIFNPRSSSIGNPKEKKFHYLKRDHPTEQSQKRWTALVRILEKKISCGDDAAFDKVSRSILEDVGRDLNVSIRELQRIWSEYQSQKGNRNEYLSMTKNMSYHGQDESYTQGKDSDHHLNHQLSTTSHRHHFRPVWDEDGHVYKIEDLVELIARLNNSRHQRLHGAYLAAELLAEYHLKISKSTCDRILQNFHFDKEIIAVKPYLTIKHRRKRLLFVLSQIKMDTTFEVESDSGTTRSCYKFDAHHNRFEIDEKWFQLLSEKAQARWRRKDIDESQPSPKVVSKDHIPKIMFLIGVGVPQYNPHNRSQYFDGKLGIWPLAVRVPAARGSANRPAGTLETTPSKYITIIAFYHKNAITSSLFIFSYSKYQFGCFRRLLVQSQWSN